MEQKRITTLITDSQHEGRHYEAIVEIEAVDSSLAPVALVAHSLVFGSHEFRAYDNCLWTEALTIQPIGDDHKKVLLGASCNGKEEAAEILDAFSRQHILINEALYVAIGDVSSIRYTQQTVDKEAPILGNDVAFVRLQLPEEGQGNNVCVSLLKKHAEAIAGKIGCAGQNLEDVFTFYEVIEPELFGLEGVDKSGAKAEERG